MTAPPPSPDPAPPSAPPPAPSPAAAPGLVDARQSLGAANLDDLFPEGRAFRSSLVTFSVLLVLASFIASFGLYQDSVASIIGAMVVAPLGGAIMAFAGALVTARSRWQWMTGAEVLLGSVAVIVIGFLVSFVMPDILELTPSLDARTSPGLLDLGVALTAGAAGAYVAARRTGSDALPGVAIAVALVPPLATVGICLELGRPDDAAGALFLFVTNFAAIVVAACVVFTLTGAAPSREMLRERHRVRNGFVAAVIALVIIAIPLAVTGIQRATEWIRATTGAPYVREWVGDRDLHVREWSVEGNTVTLLLTGPDAPADPQVLAARLAAAYGGPVTLEVEYTPTTRQRVEAAP
ncbi:MAG TPA: DUF389 domain-containing protein [Candidatus Nanopelagicales bacterium]|nr:DUF389 domain-containing protein [Candidatus Nanopelagicales bacterium]